ncbi:glycoside hydrolase family 2 TIM barrel-domain containing protein [Danxiaibacter flavus]|uniref:Glycoside hydrolase family 2 TIM barrel-domain containing protein n=1 Tax=Danxiaibacter flavus TaxID=3049108 RepID=A0ABV3ZHB9_9BACT|nr:glycoside hydrolase family 2 TIM barrel-domain containing protein [Chitinophagaceae bacterium DXS]
MKLRLILVLCFLPAIAFTQGRKSSELNGQWTFAMDPLKVGEQRKWFENVFPSDKFDKVKVPHCFSVDPRYMFYTGTAWYFKRFAAAPVDNGHVFVKFDAVFYKSKIWLNGNLIGEHEGGYTPFEFDITQYLKPENVLSVQVSNAWDTTTIPGAKTAMNYSGDNQAQVFPWINYGGLTRAVHLITRPDVYVSNAKVVAEPDLKKGDASVRITALVKNSASTAQKVTVNAFVFNNGKQSSIKFKPATVSVEASGANKVEIIAHMPANEVKLWNQDEPNLYAAHIVAGGDTLNVNFGIRKFEVSGTKLLLNGEPIKMGGCNRPLDYPGYGSMDPQEVLDKDLALIKGGTMELSRINHYPVSEYLLDWADRSGLLIIEEAGNWQMTPKQMSDTMMRRKFQSQMQEMVERDWNHPSVVAYSVGNEFQSQAEEGKAWVRDMSSFVKSLDNSRLITFASMIVFRDWIKKPEDEASQYVDFVSANIYTDHLKHVQHIHELYPNKPVYISEFGLRADEGKTEEERVQHLKKAMADFRQCDYVVGASVWTFNDYFSRFPGTGANGYRAWGLVSPEREKRGMYIAWQEEFAPATLELLNKQNGKAVINVTARKDFPSYTIKGYRIRYNDREIALNTLHPGESQQIDVDLPAGEVEVELVKPGGFVILKKLLK